MHADSTSPSPVASLATDALPATLDREGALRHARRFREMIAPLYGDRLRGAYLFGSHARGEGDEDSDIDVALVLEAPFDRARERERVLDPVCAISLAAGQILMPFFLSAVEFESPTRPVHESVKAEGISL